MTSPRLQQLLDYARIWLARRSLRRKVKWESCPWNPRDFRRRYSNWMMHKAMLQSSFSQVIFSAAQTMQGMGMSGKDIAEEMKRMLADMDKRVEQVPWRSD